MIQTLSWHSKRTKNHTKKGAFPLPSWRRTEIGFRMQWSLPMGPMFGSEITDPRKEALLPAEVSFRRLLSDAQVNVQ